MSDKRPCIVCHREVLNVPDDQTCVRCLGSTRQSLAHIEACYKLLSIEIQARSGTASPMEPNGHIHGEGDPLPGGDLMVLAGPGSTRWHIRMPDGRADKPQPDDADPDAVDSVLGQLERWEADWRITFGDGAAMEPATISNVTVYLLRRLSHAAQRHPAFDEFATDIRDLRHTLDVRLKLHPQRSDVPCITCETRTLERPAPRNGRAFEWQCSRCYRSYTQEEFWMAARQQGEQRNEVA